MATKESDAEILDQAIASQESFVFHLYAFRRKVGELGNLGEQRNNLQRSIEALKSQLADLENQTKGAQVDLATVQRRQQETQKEVAAAEKELADKRQESAAFSKAVAQLKAVLEAA
jgi:chromosome segregation ATPase